MTKIFTQAHNNIRLKITIAILVACVFVAFLYCLNIYKVISNTVALQKINHDLADVSNIVQTMDSKYLTLSEKITPEEMKNYGLSQGKVSKYISRTSSLGGVALAGHEF